MDIDNPEGRVLYSEEDIKDTLGEPEQLESAYLLGIQDEPYHIVVEQLVETYDLGMIDFGRREFDPFDLQQNVLERVGFARVDLGEIEFGKVQIEQIDSQANLRKIALEKVLAYMEHQAEQHVFEVLMEQQEWIENQMPEVKNEKEVAW